MEDRFESFTRYMLQLNRYIQKIKEKEMKQFGLHATHTMCLYHLYKVPEGLTCKELTDRCKEDKAAISRSLKQLIELNLVHLEKKEDKKNYLGHYQLTEPGKELTKRINQRVHIAITTLSEGIQEEDREHLYSTLEIILKNFETYLEKEHHEENN